MIIYNIHYHKPVNYFASKFTSWLVSFVKWIFLKKFRVIIWWNLNKRKIYVREYLKPEGHSHIQCYRTHWSSIDWRVMVFSNLLQHSDICDMSIFEACTSNKLVSIILLLCVGHILDGKPMVEWLLKKLESSWFHFGSNESLPLVGFLRSINH